MAGQWKELFTLPRKLRLEDLKQVITLMVRTGSSRGLFYFKKKQKNKKNFCLPKLYCVLSAVISMSYTACPLFPLNQPNEGREVMLFSF